MVNSEINVFVDNRRWQKTILRQKWVISCSYQCHTGKNLQWSEYWIWYQHTMHFLFLLRSSLSSQIYCFDDLHFGAKKKNKSKGLMKNSWHIVTCDFLMRQHKACSVPTFHWVKLGNILQLVNSRSWLTHSSLFILVLFIRPPTALSLERAAM